MERAISSKAPGAMPIASARIAQANRNKSEHCHDVRNELKELGGSSRDLWQSNRKRGRSPKKERHSRGPIGIAVGEEDCGQRDQSALVGHLLGEQRDIAERKVRAGETAENA